MRAMTQMQPGWYPVPGNPSVERWWDGSAWAAQMRPGTPSAPAAPSASAGYPAAPPVAGPQFAVDKPLTTPDGVPLASVWLRLAARVLDSVILGVIVLVLSAPVLVPSVTKFVNYLSDPATVDRLNTSGSAHSSPFGQYAMSLQIMQDSGLLTLVIAVTLISLVCNGLYTVFCLRRWGGTPGKVMVGLRVRPWAAAQQLSWAQAAQRWAGGELAGSVVSLYVWIDYVWPLFDQRRQALHDKWPATVVVKGR